MDDIIINKPRMSCVAPYKEDKSKRMILLKETITKTDLSEISEETRKWIQDQGDIEITNHSIHLDYNYFTANEVSSIVSF